MKRWSEETETPVLRDLAGRLSAAEIAKRMGRAEVTIQKQIKDRGLPAYHAARRSWCRRDWLLCAAAGLVSDDRAGIPDRLEDDGPTA